MVGIAIVVALNEFTRDYQFPAVEDGLMLYAFGFVTGKIMGMDVWEMVLKPELLSNTPASKQESFLISK
ncbi:hypothetical protein [Pseudomonas sp. W4I3]|uniref:hypothetical protein n=1 Tax=Pseudomonas sp. W4I3 TaxID=3042294 RepID=UPI0027860F13|nr:hypothetical protein [Pseudomonas sp. W4I3]MDQ0739688.1 hypothetical protein [Pseudomonas sp. W4I3]